ncbi:uncharacterized protein LOC144579123 [Callithrix jacchus]
MVTPGPTSPVSITEGRAERESLGKQFNVHRQSKGGVGNSPPEASLLTPGAQTPAPQRRQAVARQRSLSPRRYQKTPARTPSPSPAARPFPPPPHTSNPAVGLSLAPFPSQSRSFVAAAAAAAAAATESSIPAGATWNSQASHGARGSRDVQPLRRTASLTPAPSLLDRAATVPHPTKSCQSRRSAPSTPSPAFLLRHHHYLPRRTSHTNPTHCSSTSTAPPPLAGPRACPAHLGNQVLARLGRLIGRTACPSQGLHLLLAREVVFFPPAGMRRTGYLFKKKKKKKEPRTIPPILLIGLERNAKNYSKILSRCDSTMPSALKT